MPDRLARLGPAEPVWLIDLGRQLAEALAHAHARGVIRPNLKPHNVLLNLGGQAKIADFGIAHADGMTPLTTVGQVWGSPDYVAPEVFRGSPASAQTDVYGLGTILCELATGKLPFAAENPIALGFKKIAEEPPSPRLAKPAIPIALEATILRALARQPEARFATATELAGALAGRGDVWRAPPIAPRPVPRGSPNAETKRFDPSAIVRSPVPPIRRPVDECRSSASHRVGQGRRDWG